jgi:NAD(P)-dependent dehydrogenase (short-subunit alcohol dehydrogenase family)
LAIAADLSDFVSVEKLFEEVERNFDLFSPFGNISTVSPTNWWADFEINVKGTFLVTQRFLKLLGTKHQVTIITMSTGIAYMAPLGLSAYSISKMASVRLSEYVAKPNIRISMR